MDSLSSQLEHNLKQVSPLYAEVDVPSSLQVAYEAIFPTAPRYYHLPFDRLVIFLMYFFYEHRSSTGKSVQDINAYLLSETPFRVSDQALVDVLNALQKQEVIEAHKERFQVGRGRPRYFYSLRTVWYDYAVTFHLYWQFCLQCFTAHHESQQEHLFYVPMPFEYPLLDLSDKEDELSFSSVTPGAGQVSRSSGKKRSKTRTSKLGSSISSYCDRI